jgi:hypothetical protein
MPHQDEPSAHGAAHYAAVVEPSTAAYEPVEDDAQWLEEPEELPRRPRRRLLTPLPLALLAVLLIACGFIGGVLVEKGESSSSSSSPAGTGSALASRLRALAGTRGAGAASSNGSPSSAGGFARPTAGTVAYLLGSTLYVTNSEGNTIKVTTSPGTTVTKSVKSTVPAIHPGETVTIAGSTDSSGAVTAESITVGSSGASAFSGLFGGSGGSGSGSSTGGASGGQSLFGNGG